MSLSYNYVNMYCKYINCIVLYNYVNLYCSWIFLASAKPLELISKEDATGFYWLEKLYTIIIIIVDIRSKNMHKCCIRISMV